MSLLRTALPVMGLLSLVHAYDGINESVVVGSGAPYQLPQAVFQEYLGQANASGEATVPGFNLSSMDNSVMQTTAAWTVRIAVAGGVPLAESPADSLSGKHGDVAALTSMSIDAPTPLIIDSETPEWKMCVTLAFGLSSEATRNNQNDAQSGSKCSFLSETCLNDLTSAARSASATCGSVGIPKSCKQWFQEGPIKTESFEMTKSILGMNRFFSFGSSPTSRGNDTAYDQAVTNIWPMITSWHHATGSGSGQSSASVRCLRAEQITDQSRQPDGVPNRDPNHASKGSTTSNKNNNNNNGNNNGNNNNGNNNNGNNNNGNNGNNNGSHKGAAGKTVPALGGLAVAGLVFGLVLA